MSNQNETPRSTRTKGLYMENLKDNECERCHKPFEPKNDAQRFCSSKCRAAWHREKPLQNGVRVSIQYLMADPVRGTAAIICDPESLDELASKVTPGRIFVLVPVDN